MSSRILGANNLFIAGKLLSSYQASQSSDCGLQPQAVRRFLRSELDAAFDYLNSTTNESLWLHANGLAEMIRSGNNGRVEQVRTNFYAEICKRHPERGVALKDCPTEPRFFRITEQLAWAILVESALLDR